jgi:hypothetical protein
MDRNNINIVGEKLTYLITNSLKEKDFTVDDVDIDFDFNNLGTKENPSLIIERYFVNLDVDYMPPVYDWSVSKITHELDKIIGLITDCVSEFTVTTNGKIIRGNNSIPMEAKLFRIDFTEDEKQRLLINCMIETNQP